MMYKTGHGEPCPYNYGRSMSKTCFGSRLVSSYAPTEIAGAFQPRISLAVLVLNPKRLANHPDAHVKPPLFLIKFE